jgi:hypothetical protein
MAVVWWFAIHKRIFFYKITAVYTDLIVVAFKMTVHKGSMLFPVKLVIISSLWCDSQGLRWRYSNPVSVSPLGPMTRFYPYVVLPVGRPLWREDWSLSYSAIADWSGHWVPITIHYRLIWDCVPSSSPLTSRRDYGGGILTRLHTGYECLSPISARTDFDSLWKTRRMSFLRLY